MFLAVALLAGCGGGSPAAPAAPKAPAKQELRIAMQYDLGNLDPAVFTSVTERQMSTNLYNGLVRYKLGSVQIEPDLAERWDTTPDGKEWTFYLRKGVQFHRNHGELKASDVKFTFDRLKDPALKSAPGKVLDVISKVEARDDHTVKISLRAPDPAFLDKLAGSIGFILSEKALKEKGDKYGQNPIGTGPYMFDKWTPQQETVYVAHPQYFRGKPNLERVVYVPIPDATTMYNAFEAGDVDMLQVTDPDKLAKYKKDPNFVVDEKPGLITRFFGMNGKVKPFDDKRVRQAVIHAIDRDGILNNVFKGISTKATGILAPDVEAAVTGIFNPVYDPARARALLKEAGLENGFKVTFYVPNIDRFTKPATVIQENLKAIGVTVEIKVMDTQSFLAELRKGELPMFMLSRGQDATPDRILFTWHHKKGIPSDNWAHIDIPDVNQWLDEATSTLDAAKRKDLFGKVQRRVGDEVYYYYLDHENHIYAMARKVTGFLGDPQRTIRLDNVKIQGS